MTPPELAEADLYANVLHRVLSFSAVDPGAMLAVHYKKSDEKAGQVEGVVLLQFDEPIVRKDLKIVIPGDRTLRRKVRGLAAGFSEEAGEEGRTPEPLPSLAICRLPTCGTGDISRA